MNKRSIINWLKVALLVMVAGVPGKCLGDNNITVGDIIYEIQENNSEVWVSGINTIPASGWIVVPKKVNNYNVTGLKGECFSTTSTEDKEKIKAISLPAEISSIGWKCFSGRTIKYLDLYCACQSPTEDWLSGCTVTNRLTISPFLFNPTELNKATSINTLVCPDLTAEKLNSGSTTINNVTTVILPNSLANAASSKFKAETSIKGFGDVSGHDAGKFFSFVAGEDLYFSPDENSNIKAYIPKAEDYYDQSTGEFKLTRVSGKATKGTALFLRIKENASPTIIPSYTSQEGEAITSSLKGNMTSAWKPATDMKYYAIDKTDNYLKKYEGTIIPPGVAVIELSEALQAPSNSNPAKALQLVVEDEITAIESIQENAATDTCFDLYGNPTNTNTQGIQIINGKKVIRR